MSLDIAKSLWRLNHPYLRTTVLHSTDGEIDHIGNKSDYGFQMMISYMMVSLKKKNEQYISKDKRKYDILP